MKKEIKSFENGMYGEDDWRVSFLMGIGGAILIIMSLLLF